MALIWLNPNGQDLKNATSDATFLACFDDNADEEIDASKVLSVLTRAEAMVLSYLVGIYGPPPLSNDILLQLGADDFLRFQAVEYAVLFMFDRAPEAVRQSVNDLKTRRETTDACMVRIRDARQRPPTVATKAANVGGAVVDNGPRIFVDSPDGTRNNGDY